MMPLIDNGLGFPRYFQNQSQRLHFLLNLSTKRHQKDITRTSISFDVIFVRAFSYSVLEQGFSQESRITFRSINQPVIKTYRPKKGAFKVSMTFNAILFLISYTSNAERNFHSRGQSALNYWSIRSPFREIVVT